MAQQQGFLPEQKKTQEDQTLLDLAQKTYLETDIDNVRRNDQSQEVETTPQQGRDEKNVIPPPPQFCEGFELKCPYPEFHRDFPRYPCRSASLPRGTNMVPDEEMNISGNKVASEDAVRRLNRKLDLPESLTLHIIPAAPTSHLRDASQSA
ncbi:Adenylate cyclase type 10 [Dissostichus eleginoides]|uniref:Adenylate cyclase type 10 n=1 Tax=Dissostichus eleginoides TaxID=100907 RepID=A0AAD9F4Q9_DISEL|nr:Adenylate cyclase type 10 [Dissostichus eleginoides]